MSGGKQQQPSPLGVVAPFDAAAEDSRAEIAQLREQREQLAAARAARVEADELARKLVAERLALKSEQAIEAAEREHGPLGRKIQAVSPIVDTHTIVIVKRAHPAAFKRFIDRGKHTTKDLEELVRLCLVFPTLSEFEAMCDELPILINRAADAVAYLAGVRSEDVQVKP